MELYLLGILFVYIIMISMAKKINIYDVLPLNAILSISCLAIFDSIFYAILLFIISIILFYVIFKIKIKFRREFR